MIKGKNGFGLPIALGQSYQFYLFILKRLILGVFKKIQRKNLT